jgi:hypothetical protein
VLGFQFTSFSILFEGFKAKKKKKAPKKTKKNMAKYIIAQKHG